MHGRLSLAGSALLLASIALAGDPAYLVQDIRTDASTFPLTVGCMIDAGPVAFFFAEDEQSGGELWVTDGTAEGTRLFVDISPTGTAVYPYECPELMPPPIYDADSGLLYFVSLDDGNENGGLWRSDGTVTGTFPLDRSSFPPVAAGGTVFHRGTDGELWKTDGTASGTTLVKDIRPGSERSYPTGLVDAGGVLVFFADDGIHGLEPWRSDGTTAGTSLLRDIDPTDDGAWNPRPVAVDGVAYFAAGDAAAGFELWKSDGTTAGTLQVADILPGPGSSIPFNLIAGSALVFFAADDGAGRGVWASDGTAAGTTLLKRGIWPTETFDLDYLEHALLDDQVFFTTPDAVWTSDGTPAGTISIGPYGTELTVVNDRLYYVAGGTLYESDGGTAAPVAATEQAYLEGLSGALGALYFGMDGKLGRLEPSGTVTVLTDDDPAGSAPSALTAVGDAVFFVATDPAHGKELWYSDGSSANTRVLDIRPGPDSSFPGELVVLGHALLFRALDDDAGVELWRSDGTPQGTSRVKDIRPGPAGSAPDDLFVVGSVAYFRADDGVRGQELWRTDGTEPGTFRVSDINTGFLSSSPQGLTEWNGQIYFSAEVFDEGRELWSTDGTETGTMLLREINPDEGSAWPSQFLPDGERMFFVADDGLTGREPWLTDGTESGTQRIEDIAPGGAGSHPDFLTSWNGVLYFAADGGALGLEPWRSDGTASGTFLLEDVEPGPTGIGGLAAPLAIGDGLFFVATLRKTLSCGQNCQYTVFDRELWKTDGTSDGTQRVKDIRPGIGDAAVAPDGELIELAGAALFSANDGVIGAELWTSDGTTPGTLPLRDVAPGAIGSEPRSIVTLPGSARVLMRATDWATGYEPWVSDGSASGTLRVQDIAPGPAASLMQSPEFTVAGHRVFFVADDGATGRELWALPLETPGVVPAGAPQQAPPLRVDRLTTGALHVTWAEAVCGPEAQDYAVYQGALGDFTSHIPVACGTGGATDLELPPPVGDAYVLVVPLSATLEGSYGKDSSGSERSASSSACRPRVVYESCP